MMNNIAVQVHSESITTNFSESTNSEITKLEAPQKINKVRGKKPIQKTCDSAAYKRDSKHTADGKPICRYCDRICHMWRDCQSHQRD